MEKFEPTRFGVDEFDEDNDFLTIIDAIEKITDVELFMCGSEKCGNLFIISQNRTKPNFCSFCGNEIDWSTIAKKSVFSCPKCKKEYDMGDEYCEVDGSKLY